MKNTDNKSGLRFHRSFFITAILFAILAQNVVDADEIKPIDITLVQQVEVIGEDILLGDLVLLEGSRKDAIENLKSVFIGKAPLPGNKRRIDRQYIVLRLKQNNVDLDALRFAGATETDVVRGYNQISREEIEKIVATELPELIGGDTENVDIKDIKATGGLILPKGKYTYSVIPPKNTDYLGKLLLSVYFKVGDEFEKRVYVSANVEQFADVVVIRWPLKRNHLIQDADVQLEKMNLGKLPSNCIKDINAVVGNKLKRNLNKGDVLRTDMIDIPPLIERKDVVLMVAETKSFKIVTLGESKENGYKGDLIKVKNLESNKEVYARVLDSGSVSVEF